MKTRMLALLLLAAAPPEGGAAQQSCAGGPSAPALDHVVLVVGDLDRAAAGFAREGFRLKQGRLHPNNLSNRHVKFRDGSGIELMTVAGEPGNAMAERYVRLLRAGEGGVYAALTVPDVEAVRSAAAELGLASHASESGPWRFAGFDSASPAAAVFFSSGGWPAQDPDSLVSHTPEVTGLAEAWLEGGPGLGPLLERLGARRCGEVAVGDGRTGVRYGLSKGSLVILPARPMRRPRVLGAALRGGTGVSVSRTVRPHPAFWVRYLAARQEPATPP